jgi:fumarylpyruvate hydrolase
MIEDNTMQYAVPAPAQATLPIEGTDALFPVRRIYCVGRNYAEHAREMGFDPDREPPFFFMKPADAIVAEGSQIPYPPKTQDFHYEIELVVAIGAGGRDIALESALDHVFGYAVGIDLTRRDVQIEARKAGRPWDMGKGFDRSAPCSALVPADRFDPAAGAIWLEVNGERKQDSDLSKLIWNVAEVVSYLSGYMELQPGDLIYTGTPEGVGPLVPGDRVKGHVDGVGDINITVSQ